MGTSHLLALAALLPFVAPAHADEPETPGPQLARPHFAEDLGAPATDDGWTFTFHGYARMPLRFHGSPGEPRPPYLVDDDYYLSGFAYTRVNESEWVELFVGAQHDHTGPTRPTRPTRIVVGLFASELSDWSETTLSGQGGVATAFVEQGWGAGDLLDVQLRAGMFWDRSGFVPRYDTYLLGRMHVAGLRLAVRLWDLWYTRLGYGAHADVIRSNQGFSPVAWATTGVDLGWLDLSLFLGSTWTKDSEREFSIVDSGSLRVVGGQARVAVPSTGPLALIMAHYRARRVVFLANAFELLHSTGGRGLTQNFFGPDSDNGTGSIFTGALDFDWDAGLSTSGLLRGLYFGFFGMLAVAKSEQRSDNPLENFDDRTYLKWGAEPRFELPVDWSTLPYLALRYDRVILDMDHDSMSFRVLTPRLGFRTREGLELFASYSRYFYGENVRLRPNQIPGDLSVTRPDEHVFKLQAQASW